MGLGYLLYDIGRWEECARAMRRASEIFEKAFGPDHLEIGWTLSYEGFALQRMGRQHEARVALERAVRILTTSRGPKHKETIRARQALDEIETQTLFP
jgi:tetratricopeptide (TPR) repeat protein